MEISKKQRQFLELMDDPQLTELLYGGAAGGSSAYGHLVQTPLGPRPIENIEVGDIICNSDGGPSEVLAIPWDGAIECYGITFVDGAYTEVSNNHIWQYKRVGFPTRKGQEFRLGTTEQLIYDMHRYGCNLSVPLTKPVTFSREFKHEHKVDAYLLGVLLGDGSFSTRRGYQVRLRICCPDIFIIERCRERFSGEIHGPGKRGRDWELAYGREEKEAIRELGLLGKKAPEKFVPECFKYGSIEKRKEILRGLFDTDGSVDTRGHMFFSTCSQQLAKDVQFIVRSLGGNATISTDTSQKGKKFIIGGREARHNFAYYKIYIQHQHKEWFVTLPRKLKRIKPYNGGRGTLCKRVLKIEPVGVKKAKCITTSAEDGLYLTDDFIVTHNSKSYSIGLLIVTWAIRYPGIKFFVGRKTLKSLRQSTIATLLGKVIPAVGLGTDDYHMSWQNMELTFKNGSMVMFGELDYLPSDPTYSRLGSLETDVAIIDEAGEVSKMAKDAIRSRVGRGVLTSKYGIPGKLVLASNPDIGWLKTEYFDPFVKLGGGSFERWKIGTVTLNEGQEDERKAPAYRGFLRATVYDNPFLPESYIDNLKTLPPVLKKKLLDGDWNYADEDDMLFKSGLLDKATTYDLPMAKGFNKYIGADVASGGGDRTCYTLIDNGVVITQKVSSVTANWDKKSTQPLFRLMAEELVGFAQQNGFTPREASRIAVEGNGIGQALITSLKEKGWYITEYTATHKSRSENFYQLSLDFDSGVLKIYHGLQGYDELRKELAGHTFRFDNQTPSICKKDDIKLRIGKSPDLADSLCIANYIRYVMENPELNPKTNVHRLGI